MSQSIIIRYLNSSKKTNYGICSNKPLTCIFIFIYCKVCKLAYPFLNLAIFPALLTIATNIFIPSCSITEYLFSIFNLINFLHNSFSNFYSCMWYLFDTDPGLIMYLLMPTSLIVLTGLASTKYRLVTLIWVICRFHNYLFLEKSVIF